MFAGLIEKFKKMYVTTNWIRSSMSLLDNDVLLATSYIQNVANSRTTQAYIR